jgi:hypothetical protein
LSEKKKKQTKTKQTFSFTKTNTNPKTKTKKRGLGTSLLSWVRIALRWSAGSLVQASNLYFLLHFPVVVFRGTLITLGGDTFRKRKIPVKKQIKKKTPKQKNRQNPKHPLTPIQKDVLLILII